MTVETILSPSPEQGLLFGSSFLRDHAGYIMSDPRIAIVELVANSYDAGATEVKVVWPEERGRELEIADNGTGMTLEQFNRRWRTLSYNRLDEQGAKVEFPAGTRGKRDRIAFGQNGKGRHGAFCFADEYWVETWRDGLWVLARVELTSGGEEPFHFRVEREEEREGHGTIVRAMVTRRLISPEEVEEALGSKFLVDPTFDIYLNGKKLELLDLEHLSSRIIAVPPYGEVTIHQIDATVRDRTTHLKGITWWVNRRMVGEPSWSGLTDSGAILDGRTAAAKTHSFVIEADILKEDVKHDWSGFHATKRSNEVKDVVLKHVTASLREVLAQARKEKKRAALEQNRDTVKELPRFSKLVVDEFVDEIQQQCPTMSEGDLSRAVGVFAKLEQARSGYDLLKQLLTCSPEDLDTWNEILKRWSAREAEIVLSELEKRLRLIDELQKLVRDDRADELHDLQPLFEKGLWIFGPEYEAVDFRSNRGMAEVIRRFLKTETPVEVSRRRMDFVIREDSSIGLYAADSYDESGEIIGIRKLLILELKRGDFEVTQKELDQGRDYARELVKVGAVQKGTAVVVFVLGASIELGLESLQQGQVTVTPLKYDTVLSRAHSRTFNLHQKIQAATGDPSRRFDVLEVLGEEEEPQLTFFE
jgi:Histidine kinase-, DNA gyrase B-, and HSP90-like ATPase